MVKQPLDLMILQNVLVVVIERNIKTIFQNNIFRTILTSNTHIKKFEHYLNIVTYGNIIWIERWLVYFEKKALFCQHSNTEKEGMLWKKIKLFWKRAFKSFTYHLLFQIKNKFMMSLREPVFSIWGLNE